MLTGSILTEAVKTQWWKSSLRAGPLCLSVNVCVCVCVSLNACSLWMKYRPERAKNEDKGLEFPETHKSEVGLLASELARLNSSHVP